MFMRDDRDDYVGEAEAYALKARVCIRKDTMDAIRLAGPAGGPAIEAPGRRFSSAGMQFSASEGFPAGMVFCYEFPA